MSPRTRALLLRQLHHWHWMSSALALACMLLFSITGITLNHAADIEARPERRSGEFLLPDPARPLLDTLEAGTPLPAALVAAIDEGAQLDVKGVIPELSEREAYIALPRPGGDAWLSIDRRTGEVIYEETDRGLIALLNDLHKGRDSGVAWRWLIDIFAAICIIFCLTGLALLWLHARRRPSTWPITGLGLILPLLLVLFLVP